MNVDLLLPHIVITCHISVFFSSNINTVITIKRNI